MSENEKISARDLYQWKKGRDDIDIKILSALNCIIDSLTALIDEGILADIIAAINLSDFTIADKCDELCSEDELVELSCRLVQIRTLLFGDKIDYTNLLKMLKENVSKCGYTSEMADKLRKEAKEL